MRLLVLLVFSFALCCCGSSPKSWFPPSMTVGIPADIKSYAMSREQARAAVLSYCEMWLEYPGHMPRLPYRETFERAMDGDLRALHVIFADRNYHTGDNEAWSDARWPLLHAVGDEKFAAFLRQIPQRERKEYSKAIVSVYVPESQLQAYASKRFPRVWAIYERENKKT